MAGLQRTEISTEIADFVWFSHSPERNRFGKELKLFVQRHTQGLRSRRKYFDEAIGHYGTGRDIIDGDTVWREVSRNSFGHDRDAGANRIRDNKISQGFFYAVAIRLTMRPRPEDFSAGNASRM